MSSYNICYWAASQESAWNDIYANHDPDEADEFYYGDNKVTAYEKTDTHLTIRYSYDSKLRKLSKRQALNCLKH